MGVGDWMVVSGTLAQLAGAGLLLYDVWQGRRKAQEIIGLSGSLVGGTSFGVGTLTLVDEREPTLEERVDRLETRVNNLDSRVAQLDADLQDKLRHQAAELRGDFAKQLQTTREALEALIKGKKVLGVRAALVGAGLILVGLALALIGAVVIGI